MPKCKRKLKNGKQCQRWAKKSGSCRMHGGSVKSTNGEHFITFGITTKRVTEEEMAKWMDIEINSVDDEIRLVKVRIERVRKALDAMDALEEGRVEDVPDMIKEQITTVSEFDADGKAIPVQETIIMKRQDYEQRLKTLVNMLESLYRVKSSMGTTSGGTDEIAKALAKFINESNDPFIKNNSGQTDE